jgi:hypothetical protein
VLLPGVIAGAPVRIGQLAPSSICRTQSAERAQ